MRAARIDKANIFNYDYGIIGSTSIARENDEYYLEIDNGRYKISRTGAEIVSYMLDKKPVTEIVDQMGAKYGIEKERIVQDVLEFLKGIYRHNILAIYNNSTKVNIPSWRIDALKTVQIVLTDKCNLRCRHCFLPSYQNQLVSLHEYESIFQQLYELGNIFINFSGGELFVRKDVFDIFKKVVATGIDYGINTNGTLADKETIHKLKENPPKDVGISLYGHNRQLHEIITGSEGSFSKTINAIRLFINSGFNVTIKTMVTKFNIKNIDKIDKLARGLGATEIVFDPVIFRKNDGGAAPLEYRMSIDDLREFEHGKFGKRLVHNQRKQDSLICNAGITRIAIDSDGTIYPCSIFRLPIGNVKNNSIKEVMETSDQLHEYLQYRVRDLPKECLGCEGLNYCKICPGLSLNEYSDYRKRHEFECLRTKIKLNYNAQLP